MSTGPLGMTWVSNTPNVRPRGETANTAAPEPQTQAPAASPSKPADQSLVTNGQGLLLEWAGSAPAPGSGGTSSGLGLEWASASKPASPPPQGGGAPAGGSTSSKPAAGGGLGIEWKSGSSSSSAPLGGSTSSPPTSGGGGLGLEWRSGSSTSAPAGGSSPSKPSNPTPAPGGNSLGLTWVGGSSGTTGSTPAAPLDPEAQRLAQIKTQLTSPLPSLPGPAQGANWKQNDLMNRANLIKGIRADAALQSAFQNWESLPADAKLAAGNRIAAMEGQIYGFQPAPIQIDAFLKKPSYGYYHPTEDKVHVSPDTLADLREFVNTVTHEQAHAYQWEKGVDAKKGKLDASDPLYNTAISWYENFFDYAQPAAGYEAYRTQPIEAHAFATGDGVAAGIFA